MEIKQKARENFQELLYEKSEIFAVTNYATSNTDIHDSLKDDPR